MTGDRGEWARGIEERRAGGRRWLVVVGAWWMTSASACTGAPPARPIDVAGAASSSASSGGAATSDAATTSATAATSAATQAAGAVVDDRQAVLQLVLDHPALTGFWHQDLPDRAPLVIMDNVHTHGVALTKFDQAVDVAIPRALGGRPFLVVHALELGASEARVRFEYAVEGLVGVATLKREGGAWVVEALDVAER